MTIELIRHTTDPMISVYSGGQYFGTVFPPISGWSNKYEASPNNLNRAAFDTEQDAISHVVANA